MRKGFTLIELLVVVLIIGILAAISLPQYQKAVTKSRFAEAMLMVRSISDAQDRYYMAMGEYAPTMNDLDIEMPSNCAISTVATKSFARCKKITYSIFTISNQAMAQPNAGEEYEGLTLTKTPDTALYCYYYTSNANGEKLQAMCKALGFNTCKVGGALMNCRA
ncbi:prepilin-type N-terminal cleavage/methylation domain-containing protein [Elusimicrobium simillimum]|uniref:type IV pilin protein n=1 Tax=Elusimicrobium simillimum TaxID=3143438 RepID=UPI003C6F4D9D